MSLSRFAFAGTSFESTKIAEMKVEAFLRLSVTSESYIDLKARTPEFTLSRHLHKLLLDTFREFDFTPQALLAAVELYSKELGHTLRKLRKNTNLINALQAIQSAAIQAGGGGKLSVENQTIPPTTLFLMALKVRDISLSQVEKDALKNKLLEEGEVVRIWGNVLYVDEKSALADAKTLFGLRVKKTSAEGLAGGCRKTLSRLATRTSET